MKLRQRKNDIEKRKQVNEVRKRKIFSKTM
jgi:hypothetical protein